MNRIARLAAAAVLLLASAIGRADTAPALTPADTPLPKVALADDPVDFDALRDTWGRRMDFHVLCESSLPAKALGAAQAAKDFAAAYELSVKWLATCPVDERVHLLAFSMAMELHDQAHADLHKRWYRGLVGSVLKTGDGKTPQTAFKTISVGEEYAVLQALGLQRGSQALLRDPLVDELTAKGSDGAEHKLYFNPELHFVRLRHDLAL